jgi:hypothetical protein
VVRLFLYRPSKFMRSGDILYAAGIDGDLIDQLVTKISTGTSGNLMIFAVL